MHQARINRSGGTGAIHLEQVQTRYHPDEPPVLNGFNLQVQDGEIVCLLGPSGVGKTTALRVIAGFERVINGYVRLPTKPRRAKRIRALNAEIGRLAESRSLPIVRVFDHFADDRGGIRVECTYDNLHLTGVGYQEWYTLLEPHLRKED